MLTTANESLTQTRPWPMSVFEIKIRWKQVRPPQEESALVIPPRRVSNACLVSNDPANVVAQTCRIPVRGLTLAMTLVAVLLMFFALGEGHARID